MGRSGGPGLAGSLSTRQSSTQAPGPGSTHEQQAREFPWARGVGAAPAGALRPGGGAGLRGPPLGYPKPGGLFPQMLGTLR